MPFAASSGCRSSFCLSCSWCSPSLRNSLCPVCSLRVSVCRLRGVRLPCRPDERRDQWTGRARGPNRDDDRLPRGHDGPATTPRLRTFCISLPLTACFGCAGEASGAEGGAWSGTPIQDTSCCHLPLTGVPYLRFGPRRSGIVSGSSTGRSRTRPSFTWSTRCCKTCRTRCARRLPAPSWANKKSSPRGAPMQQIAPRRNPGPFQPSGLGSSFCFPRENTARPGRQAVLSFFVFVGRECRVPPHIPYIKCLQSPAQMTLNTSDHGSVSFEVRGAHVDRGACSSCSSSWRFLTPTRVVRQMRKDLTLSMYRNHARNFELLAGHPHAYIAEMVRARVRVCVLLRVAACAVTLLRPHTAVDGVYSCVLSGDLADAVMAGDVAPSVRRGKGRHPLPRRDPPRRVLHHRGSPISAQSMHQMSTAPCSNDPNHPG